MNALELLGWQWSGYAGYHRSRANLLIHIVAVPLFVIANGGLVGAVVRRSATLATISVAAILVSLILQGRGHRLEAVPPEPFTGPANAVSRIVLEQWITFPRFVLSGRWLRAVRTRRGES